MVLYPRRLSSSRRKEICADLLKNLLGASDLLKQYGD
jgi:hypothetical protein